MAGYARDLSTLPIFAYDEQPAASQFNALANVLRWVHESTELPAVVLALAEAPVWYTDADHMFVADLVVVHRMPFLIYRTWDTEADQFKDVEQPQLIALGDGLEDKTISLSESVDDFLTVDLSRHDWLVDGTVYRLKNVRMAGEFMIPYVPAGDEES